MIEKKRKHFRINSLNLLSITIYENNNIVKQGIGRTLNISESGVLLETHFPVDPDHTVLTAIGLKNDLVDIKGNVVRSVTCEEGKFEIGIQFLEMDKAALMILKKYIEAFSKQ